MPSMEVGGTQNPNEDYLITLRCTWENPSVGEFLREWQSLYDSKSGERGIFNRQASITQAARNGRRRTVGYDFGTTPAVKSFYDHISSAISLKSSYDLTMTLEPWNEKCDWPPLLGPFSPLSLSLSISGVFGERILRKNGSLAYRSQESLITQRLDGTEKVVTGLDTLKT